ncbi:olee1-like protein [Cicer arietinum]|uniref:Olee1-like protein n=1 Tax=Cicer arietinum TaxID=3827 RepID=A0A1S2X9W4_CICAR|nr:olee1-like protein [Cicer arietinum]
MAKSTIILISTLCFLSFFGSVYCNDRFFVEGVVYCDTCRTQFITKLTEFMEGATVRMECKEDNGTVTFSKEAVTDASGTYRVEVDGDHEDEVCEITLAKSPRKDCSEVDSDSHLEQAARISITNNNGIVSPLRTANPLGFLKKERLPGCADVLKDLGINEDGSLI